MFRLHAAVAICGAALTLAAIPASALDPHAALAQYGYQSWQTDSGLPQNTVHSIVQGHNGFLWIATEGGLVRFDGVAFAVLNHANTPQLPSDLIDDVMEDASGVLWISTSGGLARLKDGRIEAFGPPRGIPATQVWRTWQDPSATVWALTAAGLFRVVGDHAQPLKLDQDLTESSTMIEGTEGSLWLGTAEGLMQSSAGAPFHPAGGPGEVLALARAAHGTVWAALRSGLETCSSSGCISIVVPGGSDVNALAADDAGRMWIGTDAGLFVASGDKVTRSGQTAGPVRFLYSDRQGMVWAATAQGLMRIASGDKTEFLRGGDVYLSAAEDREGDLWLGTESGGLAVLRDRKFSTLTSADGLTDEYVLSLAQSPSGDVWAGTKGGGVNIFHDGRFRALTPAQRLAGSVIFAVATAPNGDVWAGTPDGLNLIRNAHVRTFTTADGLADDYVRSLFLDARGKLWIGTRHGLSRYANGVFTTWSAFDGLGSDLIGAMTEGPDGTLWIGTLGGLSRMRNDKFINFTTKDGLSSNVVTALHADPDGTLWIGTNDGGLNRMRAGKIVSVRVTQLPERVIGILEDPGGYLWISSNSGIYRVSRNALDRLADGGANPEVMRFGVEDGMRISECSSGGHPPVLSLRDGGLWFATLKGIARIDPVQMPVNRVPPQVTIERVGIDDQPQATIEALTIAPGHSHYEFDYAGLSFVAPQKVEYKYQLEGFDPGWVDAGTRRVAFYTNLPHGHYTFRVMARNNDGVWSTASATSVLTIEPHYYQTLWFRVMAALAFIGLGYAVWRRRLLGVEREFQAVLGERTRIAREIHDTLAQGFVAVSVQLELIAQLMHSSAAAAKEQLEQTRAMVRSSLEDARISIWELRSQTAAQEDLATRLLKMADEVVARAGSQARTQMQVNGTYRPLEPDAEREVVRIAREAVTNAVRHGSPATILLRLVYDQGMFGMEIRDDGRGFAGTPADGSKGHFGLTGMRERARAINGTLAVESSDGQGTRVQLELPLGRETAGRP
jgi:signal transduction histidine kinase/ligand-binding sensor domain-containing protein